MSGKEAIYWDSCIFIAYFKQEIREDPNDLAGIEELMHLFEMKQCFLATSVVTISEVLQYKTGNETHKKFRDFLNRQDIVLIEITRQIADIAQHIREKYRNTDDSTLSTPDCLQLASAIRYKCSPFYTFDGCTGKKNSILKIREQMLQDYNIEILRPSPKVRLQPSLLP